MRPNKRSLFAAAVSLAVMLALSLGSNATSVYGQEAPDTEATPAAQSEQPLSAFVLFLVPALDPNSDQAQNVEACRLDQLLQDSGIDPTVMGSSQDSASTQLSSDACALLKGLLGGIKDAGAQVSTSDQATATATPSSRAVTVTATPSESEATPTPEATQTETQAGDVPPASVLAPDLAKRCSTQDARDNDEVCQFLFQNCGGRTAVDVPQQGPPCPIDQTQTATGNSSAGAATGTPTVEAQNNPTEPGNQNETRRRRSTTSEVTGATGSASQAETASASASGPSINVNVIIIPMISGAPSSGGSDNTSSNAQLTSTAGSEASGQCTLSYLIAHAGVSVPMVQTDGADGMQGVAEVPNTPLPDDVCSALTKLFDSMTSQSSTAPAPTATSAPAATPTPNGQEADRNRNN